MISIERAFCIYCKGQLSHDSVEQYHQSCFDEMPGILFILPSHISYCVVTEKIYIPAQKQLQKQIDIIGISFARNCWNCSDYSCSHSHQLFGVAIYLMNGRNCDGFW